MPSNYELIRNDDKRKDALLNKALTLLGKMYSDRTHFVFELLQNAEDAGASRILFRLFDNRLEVTHDGRPFNELDVRGVCGVGEGTKAEDLTQIGKFGIGFKSVYAYTSTPEVHSGDESFRIENYVRP
jgi:HSP90 family molecular chaperone